MIKKNGILFCIFILIIHYSCVKPEEPLDSDIVINELMPVNSTVVTDQDGEYEDWIELFNKKPYSIDISGYHLSDKKSNVLKWKFPDGTSIRENGYLIIWADSDTTQMGLHANFKLSSLGENVIFSKPDGTVVDKVQYPAQSLELSYSRNPDGSGIFKWQNPTFNKTNNDPK